MNQLFTLIVIAIFSSINCLSQTINFTDLELKRFLINELCVDTTYNGVSFSNDISVDLNGDNEIQVSEAKSVQMLELMDLAGNYSIKSLQDLNSFPSLKYLKILYLDSVVRVTHLNLDSLKSLWIASCTGIRVIDISNLPGITKSLRLEGLGPIDTLNIKNGTVAFPFSLFYTVNVKYACVDSIAAEYDAFYNFGAMLPGALPSLNCTFLDIDENHDFRNAVLVFPNPAKEYVEIKSKQEVKEINILNAIGQSVIQETSVNVIEVSSLKPGVYFIVIQFMERTIIEKLIIE